MRRGVLLLALLAPTACSDPRAARFFPPATPVPSSGPGAAAPAWDELVVAFLRRWDVPGAAVAATHGGRLVYARGYGYADAATRETVQPRALFRIGSVSKLLTSLALLRAVDDGRLGLDDPLTELLPTFPVADERMARITVRHLLAHQGGWDRARSGDPIDDFRALARRLGVDNPVSAEELARDALTRRLDHDPGTHFAYSNLGYSLLGRVLETVTDESYEDSVIDAVLAPAGIGAMRLGRSRVGERAPGEVLSYDHAGAGTVESLFAGDGRVARQYGGSFCLETLDAAGGWLASAVDLVALLGAIDGLRGGPLLSPARLADMTARGAVPEFTSGNTFYGLGTFVTESQGAWWWHGGSHIGLGAFVARAPDGRAVALLVSTRAEDDLAFQEALQELGFALFRAALPDDGDLDLYPQLE